MVLEQRGAAGLGQADQTHDQRRWLGNGREPPHRAVPVDLAKLGRAEEVAVGPSRQATTSHPRPMGPQTQDASARRRRTTTIIAMSPAKAMSQLGGSGTACVPVTKIRRSLKSARSNQTSALRKLALKKDAWEVGRFPPVKLAPPPA